MERFLLQKERFSILSKPFFFNHVMQNWKEVVHILCQCQPTHPQVFTCVQKEIKPLSQEGHQVFQELDLNLILFSIRYVISKKGKKVLTLNVFWLIGLHITTIIPFFWWHVFTYNNKIHNTCNQNIRVFIFNAPLHRTHPMTRVIQKSPFSLSFSFQSMWEESY